MNQSIRRIFVAAAAAAVLSCLPVLAETRIEKDLKLDSGGKLTIDSDAGSIEVTGSSRPGAHVLLTSDKDDFESRFDLKMEALPGELRITLKKKGSLVSWSNWFEHSKIHFEIDVPSRTATVLGTGGGHVAVHSLEGDATLQTSGGHIEVADLQGSLTAGTSGGHISIKHISGNAHVETSGGHISADDVAGNLDAETSGGHIEIRNAKGRVNADTSGGHVEVGFAKGNAKGGKIESSGGGITVSVDPNVDLAVDASTSGGSVRTDIPVKITGKVNGSSIRGTLGKGGETLYVHTSGGSVNIGGLKDAI